MKATPPPAEFSRVLIVGHIPAKGIEQTLEARPAERAALAGRFDLIALDSLTATLTAVPGRLDSVTVTGSVRAEITQRCIITLNPLPAVLDLSVNTVFLPAMADRDGTGPAEGADMDEDIEFYERGRIDLGELVAQQLATGMNPYPRTPGAEINLPDPIAGHETNAKTLRPALADLTRLTERVLKNPDKPSRKG